MMYPLVSELAGDGIPVAVTCRVLCIARQPYYRWLSAPVSCRETEDAYLVNAIRDAPREDPEFGYRFLAHEVRDAGFVASDRTVWKHASRNRGWSVFGKKRVKNGKVDTPVFDDHVQRSFTAAAANELWLTDITEHSTREGKVADAAIDNGPTASILGARRR